MTARISSIPGKTRAHRARLQWRILLKSQFDRLCEALQRFFFGLTLAICARNLGTVCNEPRTILLDDCCKFVCHGVPCCSDSLSQREEERTGARLSVPLLLWRCSALDRSATSRRRALRTCSRRTAGAAPAASGEAEFRQPVEVVGPIANR